MRRSVKLNPLFEYPVLERFWKDVDQLGFHGVYAFDHLYGQRDSDVDPFEAWTILAAMAAATSRARIGLLVSPVTFRHPAVLAKMAVTVDHLSGGRLDLGLGAAWHQGEQEAYGIAFPPASTRIAMLEEACTILRRLWTEEVVDHQGRFWTLRGARCAPRPLQEPIPLVVGGSGARKTLRVVAVHADEWSFPGGEIEDGPERFARLSGVLDGHCQAMGRDPATVRRSVTLLLHPASGKPAGLARPKLNRLQARGRGSPVAVRLAPQADHLVWLDSDPDLSFTLGTRDHGRNAAHRHYNGGEEVRLDPSSPTPSIWLVIGCGETCRGPPPALCMRSPSVLSGWSARYLLRDRQ